MKHHINEIESWHVARVVEQWQEAAEVQRCCAERLMTLLDIEEVDEAVDMLNSAPTGVKFNKQNHIEVHNAAACTPWPDGQTWGVWALIVGGFAYALVLSGAVTI